MLLKEIIYLTDTVRIPVTITHKNNSLNQAKIKLRIQKELEEYRGEISKHVEMSKGVKVKT